MASSDRYIGSNGGREARYLLALLLLAGACGGQPAGPQTEEPWGDGGYRFQEDGKRVRLLPDPWEDAACEGPGACPGQPCAEDGDCASGWCVLHRGERVCTDACGECPPGWSCRTVGEGTPAAVEICLSDHPTLCLPCVSPSDCLSAGGVHDHCVSFGADGSFCGGDCGDGCPAGWSCEAVPTVDGFTADQCVPKDGLCGCSDHAAEAALWTPCQAINGWGSCPGERTCLPAGLSECSAKIPGLEVCNGIDDDCDGQADEGTCDDHEDCTEDACLGPAGCQHQGLDGGACGGVCIAGGVCVAGTCVGQPVMTCEDGNPCTDDWCDPEDGCGATPNAGACDDGDPCTAADHCEAGVCVGILQDVCQPDVTPCPEGECDPGSQDADIQPCGQCGARARTRVCVADCTWGPWGAWGDCVDEGPCGPGDADDEVASCGSCGQKTRTRLCGDDCQWGGWGPWSACADAGACTPGAFETEEDDCGQCGTRGRIRTCSGACAWQPWSPWSDCDDPCADGAGGCANCLVGAGDCDEACQGSGKPGGWCGNPGSSDPDACCACEEWGPCEQCLGGFDDCDEACQDSGYPGGECGAPDSTDPTECCACDPDTGCEGCLVGASSCMEACQGAGMSTGWCGNPGSQDPNECCACQ